MLFYVLNDSNFDTLVKKTDSIIEEVFAMLTDSYIKIEQGFTTLSGKSAGCNGLAARTISELTGGDATVSFVPVSEHAKKLVKDVLNVDYVENDEGYIIHVDDEVTVYADSDRAKLYATYSIKDKYDGKIAKGLYYSYPSVPHRSARLYMPFKKNLPFFRKYIDNMAAMGYNSLLLEIGGAMEYKKHPEINETWSKYCESLFEFNGKCFVAECAYYRTKTSIHNFNGGGDIYTQDEMRELIAYCRERFIDVIPEVPSLAHSDYILISHPEFRECDDEPYASTACPSNPGYDKLVFELYDEVIDVFEPEYLHIGHDEWWVMGVCDKCKGKDAAKLFADNVTRCYEHLKSRGVKTMMWADKVCQYHGQNGEYHGGVEKHIYNVKTDRTVNIMGVDYPVYDRHWFAHSNEAMEKGFHQVIEDTSACFEMLPEDIFYINWYYPFEPHIYDKFIKTGKIMAYGNCNPASLTRYKERFAAGAKGISVSSWYISSENGLQFWQTTFDLGYGAIITWKHDRDETDHEKNLFETFDYMFKTSNDDILSGPHLEITHSVAEKWAEGEKYFMTAYNHHIDLSPLKMGDYKVIYKDGRTEEFPVYYAKNIGVSSAKTERAISAADWSYALDVRMIKTCPKCNIERHGDKILYKTVYPISGEVVSCEFVPKKGAENLVTVKEIRAF